MDKKYCLDTYENKALMEFFGNELLLFGKRFPASGGESYYLGEDGTPWTERPRETWITSRMAHVYSIGALLGKEGCFELAQKAINGLRETLKDTANGGWFAGVTREGTPLPNKQCYAHAFVILAASSGKNAKIPGAEELLEEALDTYDRYFWDEENQLAYDTWNTEFTVLDSYRGLNANMHTVEAFLAVADAKIKDRLSVGIEGEDKYRIRAGKIIEKVLLFAKNNEYRIPEHYSEKWEPDLECNKDKPDDPFKPYGATPGHGIEWARLIIQWAVSTYGKNSAEAKEYITEAEKLYQRAIADAWNVDGARGIVYTTDWQGSPVVHDRMHWTLAEAINTAAVLFRATQKEEYAKDYSEFVQYLDEIVWDHDKGSCFHQMDRENKVMNTVWPGKSDLYHAFQATLIPYSDISRSIAACV